MKPETTVAEMSADPTLELARQFIYQFLSIASSDPSSARWKRLIGPALQDAASDAAEILRDAAARSDGDLAPGELPPEQFDLRPMIDMLQNPALDIESGFQQVFGLIMSKQCPPYETEYYPQTFSVFRSQMLADVAGFYRAFGLEPSRDRPDRHDHIALELEFMAWMIARTERSRRLSKLGLAQTDICFAAQRRFFEKHLAWWVPAFARVLRRRADASIGDSDQTRTFYGELATALAALIHIERYLLDVPPPEDLVAPRSTEDAEPGCDQCCAAAGSLPVIGQCSSGRGCPSDD